jgi:exonuclease III
MTHVLNLMTLNINGMKLDTELYILENLIRKQGLDIVLLQVTTQNKHTGIHYLPKYKDRQHRYSNRGKRRDTSSVIQKNPHGEKDSRIHQ